MLRLRGSHDIIAELDIYNKYQIKNVIKTILLSIESIKDIENIIIDEYHIRSIIGKFELHINNLKLVINNDIIIIDFILISLRFELFNRELKEVYVYTESTNYEDITREKPSQDEQEALDQHVMDLIKIQIHKNFYREEIWKKIVQEEVEFYTQFVDKIFEEQMKSLTTQFDNLIDNDDNNKY